MSKQKKTLRSILDDAVISAWVVTLCLFAAFMLSQIVPFLTNKYLRDYYHWTEYYSVEAAFPVSHSELYMDSYLSTYRESGLDYQDVLNCRPWNSPENEPFTRISSFRSDRLSVALGENKVIRWRYSEPLPKVDSECFIDVTVTVIVSDFIKHVQKLESNRFRIQPL